MKSNLLRWSLTAGLMLVVSASPALAQGRGNRKDRDRGGSVDAQASVHVQKGDRERNFAGTRGLQSHPPGWDRGRKTGWGNCDVPPGQAKKDGCHSVWSRRRTGVRASGSVVVHHGTSGRKSSHLERGDGENPK
ncbi:MAG TPA: hypothetical protein VKE24_10925 [Candidatus Acidoferrales bacterium]|nr:hypothetical protein [Candidatus Acidoferrales bacterium]